MRRYQQYKYNKENPLECHQPGDGESGKGWIFKATGKEAKGTSLPGECVKDGDAFKYPTCDKCDKDRCFVLKEGVKGIPAKDTDGGCCKHDNGCATKKDAENGKEKKEDERLYEETGWVFHAVPMSTSLGGLALGAAVIALAIVIRRARTTYEAATLLTDEEANEEPEE